VSKNSSDFAWIEATGKRKTGQLGKAVDGFRTLLRAATINTTTHCGSVPVVTEEKMKWKITIAACSIVLGTMSLSSLAVAQQKTAKECRDERRANKAANQASGVTEKAYVAQCRGGAAPAQPTAAPAAPPAPAPTAAPASPAPAPTAAAPPARPAPPATTAARPAPSTPASPVGANQFSTEALAKARCPSDTVVWVNLTSKIYHFSGTKDYGTTKQGAYMYERDTAASGMRAAKNETHP
jgi:hypothetical protein